MLDTLFNVSQTAESLTLFTIVLNLVLAFVLCLAVSIIYRNTHRGLSYSQSFTFTLVLIGVLISVIMMVIGNSIAIAFGAFGAFSLIRFRTAIKDTKDISFILLVVAIGLAVGTGNHLIAIIATLATIAIIYSLTKINFGSIRRYDYLLNFSANHENFSNDQMKGVFNQFLKYNNLLNVSSRNGGGILDYSFNIKFIKSSDISRFIESLNKIEGINNIDIISAKNDIEY